MKPIALEGPVRSVKGELRVPSDKSISHRAVILGALAEGHTEIHSWLRSADTQATLDILKALGTEVGESHKGILLIKGKNFSFKEPADVLDAKNSGTTARLLMGVLATQPFYSVLTGDESLRKRPMDRVTYPLREMGASVDGREGASRLPVSVRGGKLKGMSFINKKASAQVKSALILAGLRAEGVTEIVEPTLSRDHTERMLRFFGAELDTSLGATGYTVRVEGWQELKGTKVMCPADPSSAAFFCALALLVEKGELLLKDVLVNPTRDLFYRKLMQAGANITYLNERETSGEPVADILVKSSGRLKGIKVLPEEVPALIDEVPILAVVMALGEGRSEVRGASELRVKESDRIKAVVENLRAMGARIEEFEDGFMIEGVPELKGASIKTYGDHRIAMAFTIAGLLAEGTTTIDNPACVKVSYPTFFDDLKKVT